MNSANAGLPLVPGRADCLFHMNFLPKGEEQIFSGYPHAWDFRLRGPAPHAGAGTYFRERTKVSKGLPKDTFGIRLGNSS